mgnify:CR=1 FL=1|tara:strand:+ start:371 stop:574 length:204 start_codon:yes stop_codon:yes gene_type:complete
MKKTINSINVFLALLLISVLFYLGSSNFRLADTNESLSNDINSLLKLLQQNSLESNRDRSEVKVNLY